MGKLQMVDLRGQYLKIKTEVDSAIMSVVESTAFINGPEVKSLATELQTYLNVKHVIPCANGTDALQIAMMALNLKPGDEVITASFTYVATAEAIALLKITPVLVDVNADTFNIDPAAIEKAITPKTKAIVPVHMFGQCADMEKIMTIARKHNLYVIEDTAQAIGAEYTFSDGRKAKAGTMGDIGCTSFFPSKNLGCYGDGGAMFTNDDALAAKLRKMANHGQSEMYIHDEIGVNSRLDSIQAAVLRIKLKHLDEYAAARNRAADYYDVLFSNNPNLKTPVRVANSTHVFHQYTLKLIDKNRDELREHLKANNIPHNVYYPLPLHYQKAYQDARYTTGMFPVSESLCNQVISLPMHTELTNDDMDMIAAAVLSGI